MRLNKPPKGHAFWNSVSSIRVNSRQHVRVISSEISFLAHIRVHTCQICVAVYPHTLLPVLQLHSSVDLTDNAANCHLCNVTSALDFIRQIHSTRTWGIYLNLVTHVGTVITQLGTSHVLKNKPWRTLTNTQFTYCSRLPCERKN